MSDYTQITSFSAKDALTTGDPEKAVSGADVDGELSAISAAIATKIDGPAGPANGDFLTYSGGWVATERATEAEMEIGTNLTAPVVPGNVKHNLGVAKGWALVGSWPTSGSSVTMTANYNVTSITRDGTGQGTVNWTTDFASSSYVAMITCIDAVGNLRVAMVNTKAAGSVQFHVENQNGNATDPDGVMIIAFGSQ